MIISDSVPGVLLPTLSFEVSPIKIGQKISNSQISAALDAIERLGPTVPINSITALDSQSLQITSGTLRIYITQQEHMSEVSSTLQTILAGFRIKGTLPAVIDLRFAKPVISY